MSRGKATAYPNKIQKPVTTNFTEMCRDAADIYEKQTGVSRSDLLEHAMRKMAGLPVNDDLEQRLSQVELPAELLQAPPAEQLAST